jgi:hypothetical protein
VAGGSAVVGVESVGDTVEKEREATPTPPSSSIRPRTVVAQENREAVDMQREGW